MIRAKRYVDANVYCRADGKHYPVMIRVDRRDYIVDSVKEVKQVGTYGGKDVLQYTVRIRGQETVIYESDGRWFVALKREG